MVAVPKLALTKLPLQELLIYRIGAGAPHRRKPHVWLEGGKGHFNLSEHYGARCGCRLVLEALEVRTLP